MKSWLCWLNLFADLLRFLVLGLRSKTSLAAENLFLRKQLAFYQERKIKPPTDRQSNTLDPGVAQSLLRLAKRVGGGDAQNLHRLAPQGLPTFLAFEMPIRPAADSAGTPTSDPQDGL